MYTTSFIVKILYLVLLVDTTAWGASVRFTGLECVTVDPTFCAFENCVMKAVSPGVKEITGKVKLFQVPVTNVTVRLELKRRGYNRLSLYSFEVDGCKFMGSKRRNPLANFFYSFLGMDKYTNLNHSCPYDHDVIVDHLRFDNSMNLRLPIGIGDYVINMYWLAYNVLRGTLNMYMQIGN